MTAAIIESELLTVEEVAEILGCSVATVRRMCATGEVSAVKSGRQWLIPADRLPPIRGRRRVARETALNFAAALRHLNQTDFKEPWVPDLLAFQDHLQNSSTLEADVSARVGARGPFDRPIEIEIPKTPIFTRTGHQLTIEDHVAFQAAVGSFAGRIDNLLPPTVYSARLSKKQGEFTLDGRQQWLTWMNDLSSVIRSGRSWMLKTDLTAYFDTIQHKRLIEDLRTVNARPDSVSALERMLGEWTQHRGVGLPQGPNVSRLLGNLYMAPVDQVMVEGPWHYSRYMDDIRIIGDSRAEVLEGFRLLERECKRRALILSLAKTVLLHGDKTARDCEDEALSTADYWWKEKRYTRARDLLREIWARSLSTDGWLDARHARFSLYRLGQLRDGRPTHRVLNSLEFLGPVATTVAAFLKPWLGKRRVDAALASFLLDPERNTSPFTSTWLMAAVADRPGRPSDLILKYGRRVVRERNEPPYHRAIALNVIAKSGEIVDIELIRRVIADEYDPVILRASLVALARAGILDKGTSRMAVRKTPALDRTVRYLTGRSSLPGLLSRSQQIEIEQ